VQPEQVARHLSEIEATLAETGQTPAEYLGMDNASHGMLRFNAEVLALRDVAVEQLLVAPEVVDGLFAEPAVLTTVCSRHILVANEEEAEIVASRLAAGEDFGTVADEVSLDTSTSGGDLGCVTASAFVGQYAEAAMTAPIGEVAGPVATDFGFHLLLVYERTAPTREEYLADPRSVITDEALAGVWTDWYNGELGAADVWVSPDYGTWSTGGIVAPSTGE
jgi:parvulin-like peptidyl-prolyl isomerase